MIGIDGQGDIRLVETKLAANKDDLLVFQGLDYYIWARAYAEMLRERLGVTKKAKVVRHYVIGATPNGEAHVSAYAPAQAAALDIGDWRCQIVTDWYGTDRRVHSELLPVRTLAA